MEENEYEEIKSELLGIMEKELGRYSAEHLGIKKKNVSHQFVLEEGAESYAKAMTIIETSRMNGKSAIKEIERIMA